MTITFRVVNGSKVTTTMQGSVGGFASTYGERNLFADYLIDYQHTLAWDGIVSSTDSAGNLLDDVTITADSGADYNHSFFSDPITQPGPVPEPSTYGLLTAAGLLALALGKKRI